MIRHCRKKINELENGAVATLQNEWNTQSKVLKMKRTSERYGTSSCSVIHGRWGPWRREVGWDETKVFEKIMPENFPNLLKTVSTRIQ